MAELSVVLGGGLSQTEELKDAELWRCSVPGVQEQAAIRRDGTEQGARGSFRWR